MTLLGRLACGTTALAMMASLTGCIQQPASPHTPPASPGLPGPGSASPSTQATPTTPAVVSTELPTEAMPVRPLAISGTHIVVQGDRAKGDAIYRVSHDSGKTWAPAAFPCANPDGCDVVPPGSDRVGRAVDGVVLAYSYPARRLDAYSLPDNAGVGSPYTLASADVYDMAGGMALLYDSVTGGYTVHSLLDGSDRVLTLPAGAAAYKLFDDGSVLASLSGAGTRWVRIATDGSTSTVYASTRGTGDVFVIGTVAWFQISAGGKPPRYCAVNSLTGDSSCRRGVTPFDHVYGLGSAGLLIAGYSGGTVRHAWLGYADGRLAAPRTLEAMRAWDPGWPYFAENATPLVSVRTDAATWLLRPDSSGTTRLALDWAIRAVLPSGLALGTETLVGSFSTHSGSFSWARQLSPTAIGAQRRLDGPGYVAAAGSQWAVSGVELRLYRNGKLARNLSGLPTSVGLTFAGSALFGRPGCRTHILTMDEDCEGDPALINTATNERLTLPDVTEDAHGSLLVYRGGDHTVSSTTFAVMDFRDATVAPITITLPDPGTGGYYTDVRLWGDWIGMTQHLPDGTMHPVLADFRTAAVKTGVENARFLALGDGIAVSVLAHTTTLQVWEFATGATQTLAASSTAVVVDGTRLAYTTASGELAVADYAR